MSGYNILIPDICRRWVPTITLPVMDALQDLGHTPVTLSMASINEMYRQLRYQRRGCYEIFQFYVNDIVRKGHIDFGISIGLGAVLEDQGKQEAHHLFEECGVPNVIYLHGRDADAAAKLASIDADSWRHTFLACSAASLIEQHLRFDSERAVHLRPGTSLRIFYPHADPPANAPYPLLTDDDRLAAGYKVSFVGSYSKQREQYLDALDQVGTELAVFGDQPWKDSAVAHCWRGEVNYLTELNTIYNSSIVALDLPHEECTLPDYCSTRIFDCLASGCLLLAHDRVGLSQLLTVGQDAAIYDGERQLVEQVQHYCSHAASRHAVAAHGRQRAVRDFSWSQRLRVLLPQLELHLLSTAV